MNMKKILPTLKLPSIKLISLQHKSQDKLVTLSPIPITYIGNLYGKTFSVANFTHLLGDF